MLSYRENTLLTPNASTTTTADFAQTYDVRVCPVGAIATASSSGSTITVAGGHSFVAGDKFVRNPGVDDEFSAEAISSVTATTLVFASATFTIAVGDALYNIGPDTSSSATPNYDAIRGAIYTDGSGATAVSGSKVTTNNEGVYFYWHHGDGKMWELIFDSSDALVGGIKGFGDSSGRLNVQDYGAVADSTTDDQPSIQACFDAAKYLGSSVYFPAVERGSTTGQYRVEDTIWAGKEYAVGGFAQDVQKIYGDGIMSQILGAFTTAGRAILDLTGVHHKILRDLHIVGDSTNVPDIGMLLARVENPSTPGDERAASVGLFEKLTFSGDYDIAPVYNYATENNLWNECRIELQGGTGRSAFISVKTNIDSVTSPAANLATLAESHNQNMFVRCGFVHLVSPVTAANPSCMELDSCQDFTLINPYFSYDPGLGEADVNAMLRILTTDAQVEGITVQNALFHSRGDITEADHSSGYPVDILLDGPSTTFYERLTFIDNEHTSEVGTVKALAGINCRQCKIEAPRIDFSGANSDFTDQNFLWAKADNLTDAFISLNRKFAGEIWIASTGTLTLTTETQVNARVLHPDTGATYSIHQPTSFSDGDATPSVLNGSLFQTANTAPTTITDFDDGRRGQTITVLLDANTTIDFSSNVSLKGNAGADHTGAADDILQCTLIGSTWHCFVSNA